MALRVDLKIAIIKSFGTQRALAEATKLSEYKLSNIVRGLVWPSSTERAALTACLGEDHFAHEGLAQGGETRSARR